MKGSFLTNYSYTDELCNVMRCMFAITQTLTYPLELFVARHAIHALAFPNEKGFSNNQHIMITLLLWGSSLAIALNLTDLGVVLELTGGVAAVMIGFVMPALLHFKMSPHKARLWQNKPLKPALKELLPSLGLGIFGALAMFFTVFTVVGNMVMGTEHGPHDAFDEATHGAATPGAGPAAPSNDDLRL
jgi:sodium-coupled neutral amino acid transporter 11